MKNYYKILELPKEQESTLEDIKVAYKKMARQYHPDKHAGNVQAVKGKMAGINEAYATLMDNEKRKAYNKELIAQQIDDDVAREMARLGATHPRTFDFDQARTAIFELTDGRGQLRRAIQEPASGENVDNSTLAPAAIQKDRYEYTYAHENGTNIDITLDLNYKPDSEKPKGQYISWDGGFDNETVNAVLQLAVSLNWPTGTFYSPPLPKEDIPRVKKLTEDAGLIFVVNKTQKKLEDSQYKPLAVDMDTPGKENHRDYSPRVI